jgi:EAL domain-containing protein (putative c-di-GMP-specific phosphodiesterase class I)
VISPDLFIPVAEKTDLIVQLGEYLLTDACHFVKRLQDKTGLACRVGVNLSARQFAQQSIANVIRRVLDDTGLSPTMLEAEITERIAMTDIEYAIETLSELRDLGVKTSMDDFGTGYSSLSYLQKMPLDTLKIDQSFISPIGRNGEGSEIARAIIAMGQSMGLHLIAEGVEYDHQYALLKDLGCDEVQGFLVSKPLARDDFTAFARSHGQSGTGA